MRKVFIIVMILFSLNTHAKMGKKFLLGESVSSLEKALVAKDTMEVNRLVNDVATFHILGLQQTKQEVKSSLFKGDVIYMSFKSDINHEHHHINKGIAKINMESVVSISMNGRIFEKKVNILQEWKWISNNWTLTKETIE